MTPARFASAQMSLCELACRLAELDVDELLAAIARTRAAAPMLSEEQWPLWLEGEPELDRLERLARSAKAFRDEVLRQAGLAGLGGERS